MSRVGTALSNAERLRLSRWLRNDLNGMTLEDNRAYIQELSARRTESARVRNLRRDRQRGWVHQGNDPQPLRLLSE